MDDRTKFAVVSMTLMVLAGLAWLVPAYLSTKGVTSSNLVLGIVVPVGVTAASAFIIAHEYRGIRAGLPLGDERSRQNRLRAGYYSFFVIGALSLGLFMYMVSLSTNRYDLGSNMIDEAIFGLLVAVPVTFLAFWSYFMLFGKDE